MRRVLAAIAALTLSLPVAVAAQDHRGDHEQGRGNQRPAAQAPAPRAPAPQARAPRENRPAGGGFLGRADQARPAPVAPVPNVAEERGRGRPNVSQPMPAPNVAQERDRRGPTASQRAPRQGGPAPNFAENQDRGRDVDNRDRGIRNRDRGREFRGDRDRRDRGGRSFNFRGREYASVRAPAFSYPRGWGYRHWDRGEFLPRIFLAAPFYFDYDWLGLPPPPPGARWVRNGPDALLVSVYDGRILDVIYDAFY